MGATKKGIEKKVGVNALVAMKKRDLLGYAECRRIAEHAIDLAYNEAMNSHNPQKVADKKE